MASFSLILLILSLIGGSIAEDLPATKFRKVPYDGGDNIKVSLVLDEHSHHLQADRARYFPESSPLEQSYTPILFWHGMGDTAYGSLNVVRLALQRKFPNISVFSVQIGGNSVADELGGYFVNVNYQIENVCKEILSNPIIKKHGALNAIGFSQGCQFLRGLIQRCPLRENGIRVKNFISLGGQHQGVYGLPNCYKSQFCEYIRYLLTEAAYESRVQEHLVQAEYWHDPNREEEYRTKNIFLADINNERNLNETYKNNLLALDNLVLVEFLDDEMVVPRESSLFGFYAPNQTEEVIPLEKSALFLEDRLGLRQLKSSGRLNMIRIPGQHLQYSMSWFLNKIASVYLNN